MYFFIAFQSFFDAPTKMKNSLFYLYIQRDFRIKSFTRKQRRLIIFFLFQRYNFQYVLTSV